MELHFNGREDVWRVVIDFCRAVRDRGGRAHLVGGCVRDAVLGLAVEDFDLEVFSLPPEAVRELLCALVEVDLVGDSFGVLKARGLPIDVALPRRERAVGTGHRDFLVHSDPSMSFTEAAARRDFTINSIAWDPIDRVLIDPFHGVADLEARILRHTSERFGEDPLRVLRGAQLVARFELDAAAETIAICRSMDASDLARERVFEEWRKLLVLGVRPSAGLRFLRRCDWLALWPELERLVGCPQEPAWHPEGDVWRHTLLAVDAAARDRCGGPWEDLVIGLACLCHDLGKPETTGWVDGRWRSKGHEAAGEAPTRAFVDRLTEQRALSAEVVPLVVEHLKPHQLFRAGAGDAAVRRLAVRVGRIDRLVRVALADSAARPPLPVESSACRWLEERAAALAVSAAAPEPLIRGRHLIERGLEPGPAFRPILDRCYEAQLDGQFGDLTGGLELLDRLLAEAGQEQGP